ncbi:MAG: hypothetical protein AUI15_03980 [Actinobacteria bacterium 13_2_20CM_2_66_6]|nr:MAG: hypothetical protein AUI15_03980 [Actinobacteria bacterium 13_2_20CM_2_66_6]
MRPGQGRLDAGCPRIQLTQDLDRHRFAEGGHGGRRQWRAREQRCRLELDLVLEAGGSQRRRVDPARDARPVALERRQQLAPHPDTGIRGVGIGRIGDRTDPAPVEEVEDLGSPHAEQWTDENSTA